MLDNNQEAIVSFLKICKEITEKNIKTMGHKPLFYAGFGDLLLQKGKWYKPQTESVIQLTPRACFANAQFYAQEFGLKYVEGYAQVIIPVHHAWVTDDKGEAWEVTWKTPGTAYLGVELDPPKKFKGSLLDRIELYKREFTKP